MQRFECLFRVPLSSGDPVNTPVLGPWWWTGATKVRLVHDAIDEKEAREVVARHWPQYDALTVRVLSQPLFGDRFPCPGWWDEDAWCIRTELVRMQDLRPGDILSGLRCVIVAIEPKSSEHFIVTMRFPGATSDEKREFLGTATARVDYA